MKTKCQHFFIVKKKTSYGFFSGTNTSRTIHKTFTDRKKARKYCDELNDLYDGSFLGVFFYLWNGKGDIEKADPLYGVDTGPG